jgi:hypothetical protein
MRKFYNICISGLCCLVIILDSHINANAQNRQLCGRDDLIEESNFTVRTVKIEGKSVPQTLQEKVEKIVGIGKIYSPTATSAAIEVIKKDLQPQEQIDLTNGLYAVRYITVDICDVSSKDITKQVDLIFYPYELRIDLVNLGNNIFPSASFNTPTFSAKVPDLALTIAPLTIGVLNDRSYGTSLSIKTKTNLLNSSPDRQADNNKKPDTLNVDLDARRSISQPFYNINTGIEYTRPDYTGSIPNASFRYSNQFIPLGEGSNWREQVQIEGGIQQKLDRSFIKNYVVGGSLKFSDNSYTSSNSNSVKNAETGFNLYAVSDSRIGEGFARFGAWLDGGFPNQSSSYQRLSVRGGYNTQLGPGHDTVGLEVMAGSGYAWGNLPEYSQFFGGSTAANFLYESLNSARVKAAPSGPILRSYGEQQAGIRGVNGLVRGGNFYWNLNFNLTFPIAGWSQPLIPNEVVADPETDVPILLSVLVKQVAVAGMNTSIRAINKDLIGRGYPNNEETKAMAKQIFDREITPAINYLTDRANLYSIKPMLMLDLAQIAGDGVGSKIWAGVGGGVQINIVNAKFETGYMQTIAPSTDSTIGNFFLRFVFQDFF